jgi:hypothetical protein
LFYNDAWQWSEKGAVVKLVDTVTGTLLNTAYYEWKDVWRKSGCGRPACRFKSYRLQLLHTSPGLRGERGDMFNNKRKENALTLALGKLEMIRLQVMSSQEIDIHQEFSDALEEIQHAFTFLETKRRGEDV